MNSDTKQCMKLALDSAESAVDELRSLLQDEGKVNLYKAELWLVNALYELAAVDVV